MKPFTSAVIVAAGSASRMKGEDKIMLPVKGVPLIVYTVEAFQNAETIDEIIVVSRKEIISDLFEAIKFFGKVKRIVLGGSCRVYSAKNGFEAISAESRFVAVHDGARPLITASDIDKTANEAYLYGAACCGSAVVDTIKRVDKEGFVLETPERSSLFAVATPQVFSVEIYRRAVENAVKNPERFSDDAGMAEAVGVKVKTVVCGNNIKVTSPSDVGIVRLFL